MADTEVTPQGETATPAESGDATQVVQTEVKEKPDSPKPDAADPAEAHVKKKTDSRQKKIAELSYQNRELSRRLDKVLGMVEAQTKPRPTDAPKLEDYGTLNEYLDARDSYREKLAKETASPKVEETDLQLQSAREDLAVFGADKYEDFEEVVFSDDVRITPVMRDALLNLEELDTQTEVAYYLGKNPKEALRISRLPPIRQVAEIGKLEVKVTSKPAPTKKPSAAPAPIEPVGGTKTPSDEIQPVEDFESFMRKRNKQLGRT